MGILSRVFPQGRIRKSGWIAIGLAAGSGFLLAGLPLGLNPFDEGIALVGAERVMNGEIPYRDFWTIYAPAGPYLFGGWMGLFGFSVLSARILTAILLLASAFTMFSLGRRRAGPVSGLAAFWTAVVWFAATPVYGRPSAPGYLLLLLGLSLTLRYFQDGKGSPFPVGLVCGLLTLFRHDWGFCFCLGFSAALLANVLLETPSAKRRAAWGLFGKRLMSFAAGILILLGPVVLILLRHVPIRELFTQLIAVHFGGFSAEWTLPLPVPFLPRLAGPPPFGLRQILVAGWEGIAFYVPMAAFLAAGWRILGRKDRSPGSASFMTAAAVCGIGLYSQLAHRADLEHALTPSLIAILLLSRPLSVSSRKGKAAATCLSLLFLASLPLYRSVRAFSLHAQNPSGRMTLPRAEGVVAHLDVVRDLQKAAARVQDLVPPGERIFVGCSRHDLIQFNDVIIYFLSQRLPATRFHELPRGIATTAKVQREIVKELDRGPVRCVVLFESPLFDDPTDLEPNQSRLSTGVTLLDDYIAAHYRLHTVEGKYRILLRAGIP